MSTFRGILILGLLLFVCPYFCGRMFTPEGYSGESRPCRLLSRYIRGFIFSWALFELVAVPFIVALGSFRRLCLVYGIALALVTLACAILPPTVSDSGDGSLVRNCANIDIAHSNQRHASDVASDKTENIASRCSNGSITDSDKRNVPAVRICVWVSIAVLLIIQCIFFIFYQHPDGDDAYYVAQSVISLHTDVMYQKEAYTGYSMPLDARHALGAFPIWIAWLSLCSDVHPTIIAHSILAPFLLTLMYCVYAILGAKILGDRRKYLPYFLLLLGLWYTRSTVSLYTAESFAYGRIWQGKAVFSNIVVPLSFAFLWDYIKKKKYAAAWLFILAFCGILCSTASVFMLSILYCCAAVCIAIRDLGTSKKLAGTLKRILPLCLAALPLLVGGVVYLFIRK